MLIGNRTRSLTLGLVILGLVLLLGFGFVGRADGAIHSWFSTPSVNTPTPSPSTGDSLEAQVQSVYQRASPAVVNITTRSMAYDFFLNPVPREGSGSGFFYNTQGHIVNNFHVVENARELQVTLADSRTLPARVIGTDPTNDLAVIQVEGLKDTFQPLPIGNSEGLVVGQFVVAIGNPFGLERTLTFGVVSATGRVIQSPDDRVVGEVIQTDAAVNPGNSGGPLLNLQGELVGVNTALLSPSGASAGIGFAIPARTVKRVVPKLISEGRYPHPWLGVQLFDITPQRAQALTQAGMKTPVEQGVMIVEVEKSSPAARDGLRGGTRVVRLGNLALPTGGDIIVAINDQPIRSTLELMVYLETRTEVGQTIQIKIIREGQAQIIPVTLAARSS